VLALGVPVTFSVSIIQIIQFTKFRFRGAPLLRPTNWAVRYGVMPMIESKARKFFPGCFIRDRSSGGEGRLFAGWSLVTCTELGKLHSSTSNSSVRSQSKHWRTMTKSRLKPFPWSQIPLPAI
jgi:hypothetical protein